MVLNPTSKTGIAPPLFLVIVGTLFFFLIVTVVYHYPVLKSPQQTTFYGTHADVRMILWALSWNYHAWSDETSNVFEANIFFPHRNSLCYSEPFIGQAVLGWPLFVVSGNVILVHNALIILAGFLNSLSAFLLVYFLVRNIPAAFFAGLAMAAPPEHFAELSHLQSLYFFGIPLLLLGLVAYFRSGHSVWLLLVGSSAVLIGATNLYFTVFAGLSVPLFILVLIIIERRILTVTIITKIGKLLLTGCLVIVVLSPMVSSYLQVRQLTSFKRDLSEIATFSADLFDYIASSSWLYRDVTSSFMYTEGHFFGFTVLALALFAAGGLFNARIRKLPGILSGSLASMITMVFCLVISFGPNLCIDGQKMVKLPFELIMSLFPPISALRALSRLGMMTSFMLLILSSSGVAIIMSSDFMVKRKRVRRVIIAVLLILVVIETIPPIHRAPNESPGIPDKELVTFLADQPAGSGVLHLPVHRFLPLNAMYQWWSTWHWQPLIFAQSGSYPPDIVTLAEQLQFFPSYQTISSLQATFPVTFIVLHEELYGPALFARIDRMLHTFPSLVFVAKFGKNYVWRLDRQGTGSHLTRLVPSLHQNHHQGIRTEFRLLQSHPAAIYHLEITDSMTGASFGPISLREGESYSWKLDFQKSNSRSNSIARQLEFQLCVRPAVPIDLASLSSERAESLPLRIEVHSVPFSVQGGQLASISVNGREWRTGSRGLAVAIIDLLRAEILSYHVFDTHAESTASAAFIHFVESRPPASVIVGAVCDDASAQFSLAADEMLKKLGIDADVGGHYRHGFAFIAWNDGVNARHYFAIEPGPVSLVLGPDQEYFQFSLENWEMLPFGEIE